MKTPRQELVQELESLNKQGAALAAAKGEEYVCLTKLPAEVVTQLATKFPHIEFVAVLSPGNREFEIRARWPWVDIVEDNNPAISVLKDAIVRCERRVEKFRSLSVDSVRLYAQGVADMVAKAHEETAETAEPPERFWRGIPPCALLRTRRPYFPIRG